ncbi:MAG: hypothetical protein Q8R60_07935 [Mycobacteriales bacterium]|nr:hypothetical protein [Mycobacteriales bacterium]
MAADEAGERATRRERARRREELLAERAAAAARTRQRGVRMRRPVSQPMPDSAARRSA